MLQVKLLKPQAHAPTVAHPGEDLGFDLYSMETVRLEPYVVTKVRTGISAVYTSSYPWEKFGLLIRDRSSMAAKGVTVSAGVIDAGYRGEIVVLLTLMAATPLVVGYSDKIAQMIPVHVLTDEVQVVKELPEAKRGDNGFGSTGV